MRIDGQSEKNNAEPMQNRGPSMRIYASSDIHSPHYTILFKYSLRSIERDYCIFILAGDIVEKGNVEAAEPVFRAVKEHNPNAIIVAVFGNEEYHDREDLFIKRYPDIIWLNDEYRVFDCRQTSLAIVGTRGALERLTSWQRKHMPWLEKIYNERPGKIKSLINKAKKEADLVLLVSHYALTKETIKGENPALWPYLYHSGMEKVLSETKPNAAIHGHSHRGKPKAIVSGVPVYNVAFPLNRRPVKIAMIRPLLF
jgi:predicted phosphohydrolase